MVEKFKQLGINEHTLEAIKVLGFEDPSEIQEKSIPLVLEGKDVIAGASTGSGKTLAFGIGVINNSKPDYGIQGLILTPTRELAEQITRELRKFTGKVKLKIISVYGGVSILRQIEDLRSAEIVVGTPGRILDHLSRRTLNLQNVKTLVLDEADRMFDMGFKDDVEKIISQCPKQRQTLLYSATISQEIVTLAEKHMINPIEVSAEIHVDPIKLKQTYYNISDGLKFSLLKHLLENEKSQLVMVFCNTRRNVDFVANNLKAMGIDALPIHGGFSQDKRNKIMKIFHTSKFHALVCTDVAARGLDIKNVSHVYNYDIPNEAKEYVHRIGRTARAGEEGKVINIITSRDYDNFSDVLRYHSEFKIKLEETPYIKKVDLKWMPEKRGFGRKTSGRFGNSREGRTGGRNNRRGGMSGSARRDDRKRRDRGESRRPRPTNGRDDRRDDRKSSSSERTDRRPDNRPRPTGSRSYSRSDRRPSSSGSRSDGGSRSSGRSEGSRPNRSKANLRSKPKSFGRRDRRR